MKYPLRNIVYEKMKEHDNATDKELLTELQRDGEDVSMRDLNKVLMQLEILGLITVRWQSKDARRIEVVKGRGGMMRIPGE
jgi:hypothetical protein